MDEQTPMEPQAEAPKSGNGAAIAAIVISLLALAAVIIFAVMMQNSLNQVTESIDELEEVMEMEVVDEVKDEEEQDIEEPADEEVLSFADRIEDLDSYILVTEPMTLGCDDKTFSSENGEISQLQLIDSETSYINFSVYITPVPEWDVADLEACYEGAGVKMVLKEFPDKLLWGSTNCGGAAPTKDQPGYDDFQNCLAAADDLRAYLGK